METAQQWVRQQVRRYAHRDFSPSRQRQVLARGPVAVVALLGMLHHPEHEPGRAAQHAVATLQRSGDERALPRLLQLVDDDDPELAMCVDAAVLSFEDRAVAPLLRHTIGEPERYGELLAELVAPHPTAPVVAAFQALFSDHLPVAVEGAWLLADVRLIPAAVQAVIDFDVDDEAADAELFRRLLQVIERAGVSAGPVALRKARRLGVR